MAPLLKIVMFFGSVREGRLGFRLAKYLKSYLLSQNFAVDLFDPEVLQFPLLQKPVYHYANPSEAPKEQRDAWEKIKVADGFVVVSAEYNHSIPPALSNMLDHFPIAAFNYKPCSIVTYSYGQYGGVRAAMQLRSFLGELGMVTPQFIFAVGGVHEALSEDGTPLKKEVETGAEKVAKELEWYARTLKNGRDQSGVPT